MATVNFNTNLPGYTVLAELGRGNTRVLKARHDATGDLVAIKQYAFAADADTLRRFEQESQIMTQVNHPNVVRVREVNLQATMPYVVMDFVEGGDLRSLLRQRGSLDMPAVTRLGLQLTAALRAIHPLHVVHRDIKPENVLHRELVSGELHFLLTDFGIAKLRADETTRTRTGQSLMTYEYAAPEQFDNPREVNEAADYYALGVVLFESVAGRVPFTLENETGLAYFMQQVLTAPLPPLQTAEGKPLPPSFATLLRSLLTRDPAQRLRDPDRVELLLEQSRVEHLRANTGSLDLRKTIAGSAAASATVVPPTPAPVPEEEEPEPTVRDNSTQWWSIGAIVLAVGMAIGLYMYSQRPAAADVEPIDSTAVTFPTDVPADTVATAVSPTYSTTIAETPLETSETPTVETQPSVDTVAAPQPRPTPPPRTEAPDSTTTMPPDSTN